MYRHMLQGSRLAPDLPRRAAPFVRNGALAVQLGLALEELFMGFGLMLRPDGYFLTSNYRFAVELMTAPHFAMACVLVGFVSLVGTTAESRWLKVATACASAGFTGWFAAGCFASHPEGLAWHVYGVLTLLGAWLVLNRSWPT